MNIPEKYAYSEDEFRDLVLLGSDIMLPNSQAEIRMYGVEAPAPALHTLRKLGIHALEMEEPIDLHLKYNRSSELFCVNALTLAITDNEKLRVQRRGDSYDSHIVRKGKKNITPKGSHFTRQDIDRVVYNLDLPNLAPPQEDPQAYQDWMDILLSRSDSWKTSERAMVRGQRMGNISAKLIAIKERTLFPGIDFHSLRGVEYRMDDKSSPEAIDTEIAFVGEQDQPGYIDFSSYMQSRRYYKKSQQTTYGDRKEIILTPLHRSTWAKRLVDEDTGIPYAAR